MGAGSSIDRVETRPGTFEPGEFLHIPPTSALQMLLSSPARDHFRSFIATDWQPADSNDGSDKGQGRMYATRYLEFWMDAKDFQAMPPCSFQVIVHSRLPTRTHTYTHVHTRTHTYTHVHTRTHTYTHVHTRTHTYTHVHTRTHTYTHVHTYTRTHVHTHEHMLR